MKITALALAAVIGGLACGSAQAAAITYELSGTGAFTLDGILHIGAFDILGTGDTANVVAPSPPFPADDRINGTLPVASANAPFSISVTLDGVGAFDVVGASYVFVAPSFNTLGFGSPAAGDFIHFTAPQLATYDLASNLGPIAGAGVGFSPQSVLTNGGALLFGDISSAQFSSAVAGVPEPAAWAMMLLGFSGIGALLRSRHFRSAIAV
jgi:hypothetical protein